MILYVLRTHGTVTIDPTHDTVTIDPTHDNVTIGPTHDTVTIDPTHGTVTIDPTHDNVTIDPTHTLCLAVFTLYLTVHPSHYLLLLGGPVTGGIQQVSVCGVTLDVLYDMLLVFLWSSWCVWMSSIHKKYRLGHCQLQLLSLSITDTYTHGLTLCLMKPFVLGSRNCMLLSFVH